MLINLGKLHTRGLIHALVALVRIAEPAFVPGKNNLLGFLVAGELVGAIGTEPVHAGAIGGLDDAAGLRLVGLVQVLLHQKQVVHVHLKVKQRAGVLQHEGEGIFIILDKADLLPGGGLHRAVAVHIVDQGFPRLVAEVVAACQGVDALHGVLRHGNHAVRVHQAVHRVKRVQIHGRPVVAQGVAAQIFQGNTPGKEHRVAVGVRVLSVRTCGEVGHGLIAQAGGQIQGGLAGLVAVVIAFRIGQSGAALIEQGSPIVFHVRAEELLQGIFHIPRSDGRAVLPGGVFPHFHLPGIALCRVGRHTVHLVSGIGGGNVHGEFRGQLGYDVIAVLGLIHPEAVEGRHGIAQHVIFRGDFPVRGRPGGHAGIGAVIGVGFAFRNCLRPAGREQRRHKGECKQHGDQFPVHTMPPFHFVRACL